MSRPRPTAVDYVVIAISPALIMTLVGSLAFFLVRVSYQGQHSARLQYILALFVFAAVLISRISIESGKGRAVLFAIPLAIATGLAMMRFGEIRGQLAGFSGVLNFLLIGLVWWCTHKLTLDCTVLDESKVQTEQGLLQYMGLDGRKEDVPREKEIPGRDNDKIAGLPRLANWWRRLANPQRKRQSHGVWVVYFSMAALPLFGVGQLFVPASDTSGRQYTFVLLGVYLVSGFGLLVTTSLISLRQYLRQRNLQMPNSMVKTWIAGGITLVLLVLVLACALPRTIGDFGFTRAPFLGSGDDLETSDYALGNDGARHDPDASRVDEQLEGGEQTRSEGSDGNGEEENENGETGESRKAGRQEKGNGNGKGSNSHDSKRNQTDDRQHGKEDSGNGRNDESTHGDAPNQKGSEPSSKAAEASPASNPSAAKDVLQSVVDGVWNLLKYAFYAVLVAIALFFAWKYRDTLQNALRDLLAELRELWNRLFSGRQAASSEDGPSIVAGTPSINPFSAFADPFLSGAVDKMSAEQLIRYTFAALEAWAGDRGLLRDPQQTPVEFTDLLADRFPSLGGELRELSNMYCRAAYASQQISKEFAGKLDVLWRKLGSLES